MADACPHCGRPRSIKLNQSPKGPGTDAFTADLREMLAVQDEARRLLAACSTALNPSEAA